MRALHLGQAKKPHQVAASIPVVILADDQLTDLICKGVRDNVLAYVAPQLAGVADVIAWLSAPAVPGQVAAADWLADYILTTVRDQLLAIVDPNSARYPDAEDDEDGEGDDPALAAQVARAASVPRGEPETLRVVPPSPARIPDPASIQTAQVGGASLSKKEKG